MDSQIRSSFRSQLKAGVASGALSRSGSASVATLNSVIASLISAGEDVAFYDPSDLTSLYQSRTGGSNVSADSDPVGIILDKAQMGGQTAAAFIAGQPELVTNGANGFNGTAGWSGVSGVTLSEVDGALILDGGDGSSDRAEYSISGLTVGRAYRVTITAQQTVAGSTTSSFGVFTWATVATQTLSASLTTYKIIAIAMATSGVSRIYTAQGSGDGSEQVKVTNFSVQEIPGYPAIAPSDAARPLYKASPRSYIDYDEVDDVHNILLPDGDYDTWTVATDGSVTFDTTTLSGGTGYALSTDNAGFGITSATLTASQKTVIEAHYA